MEDQVISIFSGVHGYLDEVPINLIQDFEEQLLQKIRTARPEIVDSIKKTKALSKETAEELDAFLKDFTEGYLKKLKASES